MRRGESIIRILFTILLCGMGLYYAITRTTGFQFGGDDGFDEGIYVNATGLDAVVIGLVFIAVGIINLALAIRSERRITVFWIGAGLFLATIGYGAFKVLMEIMTLFES